ncbi:MAG: hypothetical protein KJP02_09395 [Octadecabacter sp.]|nr:hypothetical protein [Octadecabacter sp.]
MIEVNNLRYTGRTFKAAVSLPTRNGPLRFDCRVDGPATLDPSSIKRALLSHAVRQRTRERLSLPLSGLSPGRLSS